MKTQQPDKKPFTPFVHTTGTRGVKNVPEFETENQMMVRRNCNRLSRISNLKREANNLSRQADYYRLTNKLTPDEDFLFEKISLDTRTCSNYSVFRQFTSDKSLQYVHSYMCDNRMCPICNSERSKVLQRKYINYFSYSEQNENLLNTKDFMHLTLTVPHSATGFRGEKFYMNYMRKQFNEMRKEPWWKESVFAGEYSFEFTRGDNGIHCHIHALLLVEKCRGNRDSLHHNIMYEWNNRTIDRDNGNVFTPERIAAIVRGNQTFTETSVDKILDPCGSTFVNLENLYIMQEGKDGKKEKRYINGSKDKDILIKGIMECLKYHFEPLALTDKKSGTYDMELIKEILPKIYHKSLYQKFGAFYGDASLNIKETKTDQEAIADTLAETANDRVVHPVTFEEMEREEYSFVLINPKDVFSNRDKGNKPFLRRNAKVIVLENAIDLPDALHIALKIKIKKKAHRSSKPKEFLNSNFI